jgi:DNA-binding PadR family transcriptional regulator
VYQDKSLLPREVIRLAALGTLAVQPISYAALANEVRHFISRIAGPSLDLMGTSIELLRYEGFVTPLDTSSIVEGTPLEITDAGRAELKELLCSAVRAPLNDVNKLVLALKIRFLHILDADEQRGQAEMMIEACETELARLVDLGHRHEGTEGYFKEWLDHDIGLVESRLEWLRDFRARLDVAAAESGTRRAGGQN